MAEWVQEPDGQWWYILASGIRRRGVERICETCGKTFPFHKMGKANTGQYCSRACANNGVKPRRTRRGSDHPNWRGGHISKEGYRMIYADRADGSRKLVPEHRIVMEQHLGRELRQEETVHHGLGGKLDNRLGNLELWSSRHPRGQRVEDILDYCKEMLKLYEPEALR